MRAQERMPLVVRARIETTFFGLGAFLAVILLSTGGYLLVESLRDPLGASDTGLIVAGFTLALSSFLLVYLVRPRGRLELARREEEGDRDAWDGPTLTVYGEAMQQQMAAKRTLQKAKDLPGPM